MGRWNRVYAGHPGDPRPTGAPAGTMVTEHVAGHAEIRSVRPCFLGGARGNRGAAGPVGSGVRVAIVLALVLGLVGPLPAPRADPMGSDTGADTLPVVPRGVFGWPLVGIDPSGPPLPGAPGAVTRRFRPPPTFYGRGHRGADLAAPPGTAVLAAGPGTVTFAGSVAGRGVVSVLHAGGLRTTYEPVVGSVVVGAVVARGTPLGTLAPGHAGCDAAACLHWGLRRAPPGAAPGDREGYLDPLLLVGLGRMRLLPRTDR